MAQGAKTYKQSLRNIIRKDLVPRIERMHRNKLEQLKFLALKRYQFLQNPFFFLFLQVCVFVCAEVWEIELLQAEMSFYSVLYKRYSARASRTETKEATPGRTKCTGDR